MLNVPAVYQPVILTIPMHCDFGKVPIGDRATSTIVIANWDGCDLHISDIRFENSSDPAFGLCTVPVFPMVVESECSTKLPVTFCPTHGGDASGSLEISSDDPMEPVVRVALHGVGVE